MGCFSSQQQNDSFQGNMVAGSICSGVFTGMLLCRGGIQETFLFFFSWNSQLMLNVILVGFTSKAILLFWKKKKILSEVWWWRDVYQPLAVVYKVESLEARHQRNRRIFGCQTPWPYKPLANALLPCSQLSYSKTPWATESWWSCWKGQPLAGSRAMNWNHMSIQ